MLPKGKIFEIADILLQHYRGMGMPKAME